MSAPTDPAQWYDANADLLASKYETVRADELHRWLDEFLSSDSGAQALDVGAGSGRDAAWLASKAYGVIAVEPSAKLRAAAKHLHPEATIRWLDDRLPNLSGVIRLGLTFDLVLLSGVWQHTRPAERPRVFRKLISLLKAGGTLVLTLRNGSSEPERCMHPVSLEEVERLARQQGVTIIRAEEMPDLLGRREVSWTYVILRLPNDGTAALPLLRHVILNDQKSATYKLGLLRAICRAADGSSGLARELEDDHVLLPLELIALNWLRLYVPLVAQGVPQTPTNRGPEGLGFGKDGFRQLLAGSVPRLDLRIASRFQGAPGHALHMALQDAGDIIVRMPANYINYPGGGPVLPAERRRAASPADGIVVLNEAYLLSFGAMRVPTDLWRALQRFAVWIEPALISEWCRLTRAYAERQGRSLDEDALNRAMTWADPARDVALPRERSLQLMAGGRPVDCVWSGRRLDARSLDIDHGLPWSAWPCSDLWNLLPAHRAVNQHQKRDRLPSDSTLQAARGRILAWWHAAYFDEARDLLRSRFVEEARASLPGVLASETDVTPEDVFAAMELLRLRQDQQVPEWSVAAVPKTTPGDA